MKTIPRARHTLEFKREAVRGTPGQRLAENCHGNTHVGHADKTGSFNTTVYPEKFRPSISA